MKTRRDEKMQKDRPMFEQKLNRLNKQLFYLYQISVSLQESTDVDEIYDIAVRTFVELGYDRARVYQIKEGKLYGKKCNYIPDEIFRSLIFEIPQEGSKTRLAMKHMRPVIQKTKESEPGKAVLKKATGLESATLPLIFQNEVIGQISVDNKDSRVELDQDELNFLMTFANQIAVSIHNATLFRENEKKLQTLTALYDITSTINLSLDLDKIINLIVVKIIKLLKVNICTILILNEEKDKLIRTTSYGIPEDNGITKEFDVRDSCFSEPIRNLETSYFRDISCEDFPEKDILSGLGVKSMLSVPLFIENTPIGIINIYSRRVRSFTDEEIDLLNALSNQAAIAIENSRLYERIWRDKENLSSLLDISEDIGSILNLPLLFERIVEKTSTLTDSDYGNLMMIEKGYLVSRISHPKVAKSVSKNSIRIKGSPFEEILARSRTAIINDISRMDMDSRTKKKFCLNKGICSKAMIPLLIDDMPIGMINLESRKKNNYRRIRKSLEILTNHIAIAIENARLYDEVRDFNRKLQEEVDIATRELRQKNEELKKLDEIKSEFVSNVSHELRTPLTSIAGYSKLIKAKKLGPITEQQKQSLNIIVEESDRLTRLINDVLNLSKLEQGKVEYRLEQLDLIEVIEQTIDSMKMNAKEKDISLVFIKPQNLPKVKASFDLMKQALVNLVSNAIKFSKKDGKVEIKAGERKDWVDVSVKDNGIGISEENQKKIFNKFYQVDSSMTKSAGGTGLGLVIVKKIMDIHKGKITLSSKPKRGTTFRFSLPKKAQDQPKQGD
jgi:signal transduction histidine kinase